MRARADRGRLVDLERIGFDDVEPTGELALQLGEGRYAAAVPLDRDHRSSGIEQCPGEAARAGADFINSLALESARNCSDAGQQLAIEDEILSKRLARAEAVARNNLTQRLRRRRHA